MVRAGVCIVIGRQCVHPQTHGSGGSLHCDWETMVRAGLCIMIGRQCVCICGRAIERVIVCCAVPRAIGPSVSQVSLICIHMRGG